MRFQLIDAGTEKVPVPRLCKGLGVSPSGSFAGQSRPASRRQREDLVRLAPVRSAFALSNGTSGSPRMTRDLQDTGLAGGRRRTARLRRETGLRARQPRRFKRTTDSLHAVPVAPNLIAPDVSTERPDEKGRRHPLYRDARGLAVPGGCHGSVRPARGGLGRQRPAAQRGGARRTAPSPGRATTRGGSASSFGPRSSILLDRVPGRAAPARRPDLDVRQGERLRSLHGRDVLQDLEERAGLAHGLPDPGRGEPGPGPFHRRLLQSGPTPLSAGLRQPRPVQKAHQPNRSPLNRGKSNHALHHS